MGVIPQISMALLSIIPYYMNPECGERLGFCIVLILTSLFFDLVGLPFLPLCDEWLRVDYISRSSFFFCVLSLFETALVICIFFLEVRSWHDLLPRVCRRRCSRLPPSGGSQTGAAKMWIVPQEVKSAEKCTSGDTRAASSVSLMGESSTLDTSQHKRHSGNTAFGSLMKSHSLKAAHGVEVEPDHLSKLSQRLRKQLYRQAFYTLDTDYSGSLSTEEIHDFGEFMLGNEWSNELTETFMRTACIGNSEALTFDEFARFCEMSLLDHKS